MHNSNLGTRMKSYEALTAIKTMPTLPIIARIDGKAFHSWCAGLDKPFDSDFMSIMQDTVECLLEESGAILGYTQSDEITLLFYSADPKSQVYFNGKVQKLCSVLSSIATARFNEEVAYKCSVSSIYPRYYKFHNRPLATFDCRVFQVPSKEEAVNCLIWRELDAVRNSILSVGQSKFSHQEMQNKSCAQVQEMLWQKHNINWGRDFSNAKKRGSYFRRIKELISFTPQEIEKLPAKHEAKTNPNFKIERHVIKEMDYPILTKVENRVEMIFDGAEPLLKENHIENSQKKEKARTCFECDFFDEGNEACRYLQSNIRHPISFYCSNYQEK